MTKHGKNRVNRTTKKTYYDAEQYVYMFNPGLTHNPNYSPSSKSCRGLSLAKNICTRGIDLPSFAF